MKNLHLLLCSIFCLALVAKASDLGGRVTDIPGFEDPKLLARVMSGEIVLEEKVSTKTEFRSIVKAFFNKVSPDAYTKLATNHPKYPSLFSEIKEAKTVSVSTDQLNLDYWLHLKVPIGPFFYDAYPEGHHTIVSAPDAQSEAKLLNEVTNYKDQIKFAKQTTRLIPYKTGILVEDDIHFLLTKESAFSGTIKKKFKEFFTRFVSTMRKELQGSY